MKTCQGTTNAGVACSNRIKDTEQYCHLHDPDKVGYEIPFECPRCHISGFARIKDAEQAVLIQCSQCNKQFLYAWCERCGFGGDFLHDVTKQPNDVQCVSCDDVQPIPETTFDDENIHPLYRLKKQKYNHFSRWWKGMTSYQKKVVSLSALIVLIPSLPIYRENTVYFSDALVYLFWGVLFPLSLWFIVSQKSLRQAKHRYMIYAVFSLWFMFDVSLLVEESMNQLNQEPFSMRIEKLMFDRPPNGAKGSAPWLCDWYVSVKLLDKSGYRFCAENIVGQYGQYKDALHQFREYKDLGPAVLEGRISWAGLVADRVVLLTEGNN